MNMEPNPEWDRLLAYKDKEAGWTVFRHLYWGIYLFVIGGILVVAGISARPNLLIVGGWSIILFAVFLVVYGFVASLHHRLMRRHG